MTIVQRRSARGARHAPGPVALRLRRVARWISRRLRRLTQETRDRRRGRKGVEVTPSWRGRISAIEILIYAGALLFLLWVGRALVVVIVGQPESLLVNADRGCRDTAFSCGVIGGIGMTLLSLAFGSAIFLFFRFRRIRAPYVKLAKKHPSKLVPTAGTVIGDIVGRDELCNVLMDDLRDRNGRRPHIIIGGVGTGKTAVLVKLVQVLSDKGAVPIAIRLRDAQTELDFRALARKRFMAQADSALWSTAEGEKVWRQLCKEDRIVVLADGLEEAFAGSEAEQDRDNLIRLAIAEAHHHNLPLVIASRPHNPLSGMKAAMLELEPLSQEAALEYLGGGAAELDERLEWLVETADVAEAPFYLQIAKELHDKGLLRHDHPGHRREQLDTRGVDRVALRLRLIDTWMRALIKGHFYAELALSSADRKAAIEHLSALAFIGLKQDSLHVKFEDLVGSPTAAAETRQSDRTGYAEDRSGSSAPRVADVTVSHEFGSPRHELGHDALKTALEERLENIEQPPYAHIKQRLNCAIAATNGMQLGLVEPYRDGVRFEHSIMQAYLGARFIPALKDAEFKEFMGVALRDPGRELLMAIVMYSRSRFDEEPVNGSPSIRIRADAIHEPARAAGLRNLLRTTAKERDPDAKTLDMLASALEIDAIVGDSHHAQLANDLASLWERIKVSDRAVEEAKLRAVARFGEAVRTIGLRPTSTDGRRLEPAYARLFAIGGCDESYRVRVAAVQEIGGGGDLALDALHDSLEPRRLVRSGTEKATGSDADEQPSTSRTAATSPLSGGRAREEPEPQPNGDGPPAIEVTPEQERRRETMRAWLVPMLVGSAHDDSEASGKLDLWLSHVGGDEHASGGSLPLAIEVALAQGFKHAANRRPEHPLFRAEARDDLAERAREMLGKSRFWFSRLALVHALCLWALPETTAYKRRRGRSSVLGTDPAALVDRWLALPDGEQEHPFVIAARDLAILALESGQPERFIWIDESGVVMKVGTRTARPGIRRRHHLWIPPSTGWSTLDPRAQQLVGDVLLLLNLAERGRNPTDRDRRLKRAQRNEIPPCLIDERDHLEPKQTVGTAKMSAPGSNCKHGCQFDLCPYPPKGQQAYRSEFSEAFCRRQQTLLGGSTLPHGKVAPWQAALPKELKRFWVDMEERARF